MILFNYRCDNCQHYLEKWHKGKRHPTKCPECKQNTLYRLFSTAVIQPSIVQATTVGKQAEINAKRMGKELCQLEMEKDKIMSARAKRGKNLPFWHDGEDLPKPRKKNR